MLVEPNDHEAVRVLREAAGLSQAELAAHIGLTEAQIRDVESGVLHPASDLLRSVAALAGYQYLTALAREVRPAGDIERGDQLRELVSQLLFRTTPTEPVPQEALMTPWLQVSVGLLTISRELLRSLFLLETFGHAFHAGPALTRSIFEGVTAAFWLADVPAERDDRFVLLARAGNRAVKLLAEEDPAWAEELGVARDIWQAAGGSDDDFGKKLRVDQMLTDETRSLYATYRYLSTSMHPSWWMSGRAFEEGTDGTVAAVEVPLNLGQYAFAASMVWRLAFHLECVWTEEERSGLGFSGDRDAFAGLGVVIAEYTKG